MRNDKYLDNKNDKQTKLEEESFLLNSVDKSIIKTTLDSLYTRIKEEKHNDLLQFLSFE